QQVALARPVGPDQHVERPEGDADLAQTAKILDFEFQQALVHSSQRSVVVLLLPVRRSSLRVCPEQSEVFALRTCGAVPLIHELPSITSRGSHIPWSSLVDSGTLCTGMSGQGRDPGAGAARPGAGGGRVGVWPQFQQQRVRVLGLLQTGRSGDPAGAGVRHAAYDKTDATPGGPV